MLQKSLALLTLYLLGLPISFISTLPNQLRSLLKETGHENREEALLDLSHTLFFAGFRVGKRDNNWPTLFGIKLNSDNKRLCQSEKKRKRKQLEEIVESKCQNPFIIFVVIAIYQINVQQNVPVETVFKKRYI